VGDLLALGFLRPLLLEQLADLPQLVQNLVGLLSRDALFLGAERQKQSERESRER
jgi:hypothetical protein